MREKGVGRGGGKRMGRRSGRGGGRGGREKGEGGRGRERGREKEKGERSKFTLKQNACSRWRNNFIFPSHVTDGVVHLCVQEKEFNALKDLKRVLSKVEKVKLFVKPEDKGEPHSLPLHYCK